MAQIKFDAYSFANEAEMIAVIEGEGYNLETPIQLDSVITNNEDDEYLDFHYSGIIPLDELDPPTMSTDVFCVSARKGSFKIPSKYKVGGQLRVWYWSNIARYAGEDTP